MAKTTKKTASKAGAKEIRDDAGATPAKKKVAKKAAVKKTAATPAAKKVAKKKAVKKTTAKKAPAKKAAAKATSPRGGKTLTAQERHKLIEQAAYLRSEAQGFAGNSTIDWVEAEAEVDGRLAEAGITIQG